MKKALRLLSIQSHTTHGYVGNKAATFPLQTMDFDVNSINTVSLSNHPAYPEGCKGHSLQLSEFFSCIEGLNANDLLNFSAIVTGYISKTDLLDGVASTVLKIKTQNPGSIYICDPVLGDNGKFYVPQALLSIYKTQVLPLATVMTPNIFEAETLSGIRINDIGDAVQACKILHSLGPTVCILKGLHLSKNSSVLSILMSYYWSPSKGLRLHSTTPYSDHSFQVLRVDFPKIEGSYSGCGDLFTALMAGSIVRYQETILTNSYMLGTILEGVSQAMSEVLRNTVVLSSKELCIVESSSAYRTLIDKLAAPHIFPSEQSPAYLAVNDLVCGIIFDMDGTLTEPGAIDFDAMYRRIGILRDGSGDILMQITKTFLTEEERQAARQIVEEEEILACERMQPRSHVGAFFRATKLARIRTALSTRNIEPSFLTFLEKASLSATVFQPSIFRDSLNGINKPDPQVALHIMNEWEVLPSQRSSVWFVGDSKDDMLCGKAAGCSTCLIRTHENRDVDSALIDLCVDDLSELARHLQLPALD